MNQKEYEQLKEHINELENAISDYERSDNSYKIYDVVQVIAAVYNSKIPELNEQIELLYQFNRKPERYAKAILGSLQNYSAILEKDFDPLTQIDEAFLFQACEILADTNDGLTGYTIVSYCNIYAKEFNREIPVSIYPFPDDIPNKRTALYQNLEVFNDEEKFQIIKTLCDDKALKGNRDVDDLRNHLVEEYGRLAQTNLQNVGMFRDIVSLLYNHPMALKEINAAMEKYESGMFPRNILDDMRVAFELLIKEILNNDKSLENQKENLGSFLKEAGVSPELRNLMIKIVDYYVKYQNNHVKHSNKVHDIELEYVIEQTIIMMKFIVKISENG